MKPEIDKVYKSVSGESYDVIRIISEESDHYLIEVLEDPVGLWGLSSYKVGELLKKEDFTRWEYKELKAYNSPLWKVLEK